MRNNEYSDLKIVHFPEKLESFKHGRITAPICVRVKPTNACCHNCYWCSYKVGFSGMHDTMCKRDCIPVSKLFEILDDLQHMGVKAVTYSGGGEPLLHSEIAPVFQYTITRGLDLSIITNGQMLFGAAAEALYKSRWVRVSMDYATAEQMAQTRGVPKERFDKLISNIKSFARQKDKGCSLGVNFIIHEDNATSIYDAAALLRDCGVENVRFSPAWVKDFEEYHSKIHLMVMRGLDHARQLEHGDFKVHSSYFIDSPSKSLERGFHRCWYMQITPSIGADMNVYACHNKAYDITGLIGSIKDKRFIDLWFSGEAYERFKKLNPDEACRHECSNHMKNVNINALLNTPADNFP